MAFRALPVLLLALPFVAPACLAQAPLDLSTAAGRPYAVLAFDNSRTDIPLEAGDYFFVYDNQGPATAEYWVTLGGKTVAHSSFCCDAGVRLELDGPGTYGFHFNGKGQFALVRPELVDNLHLARVESNVTAAREVAFAMGRDAAPTACLRSDQAMAVQLLDSHFKPLAQQSGVHAFEQGFDAGGYALAFVQLPAKGWVAAAAASATCAVPDPATEGSETAATDKGAPAGGWALAALAALAAAGTRRRHRA